MYQQMNENARPGQATADVQQMQPQENVELQQQQTPSYHILEEGLREVFGENFDLNDEEMQLALIEHLRQNRKQNEVLAMALEQDPRLSQMLADMINGKRNAHSAMARYFGSDYMNIEEGTPEYEEMLLADEERRNELMRLADDRHEYEQNLQESKPIIENYCKEQGYDPSEFLELVWERLVLPILSGKYSAQVCQALDYALRYEQDVEDAFAAGDVKGRNTNIQRMRQEFGDGMPKGIASVAPEVAPPTQRRNTLIESALEA
ncbi:MAG: hypothetical protein IKL29_03630 [Bacteroidaceae bacterium]|nr:hypothetical protein [Bacteroidaceae bacterium]